MWKQHGTKPVINLIFIPFLFHTENVSKKRGFNTESGIVFPTQTLPNTTNTIGARN